MDMRGNEEEGVLKVRYYATELGAFPVRVWIRSLPLKYKKLIGESIKICQWDWPPGLPVTRKMTSNIWEIRTDLGNKNISRVFVTNVQGILVLLHGFIKKSQKTPLKELNLAKDRLKDLRSRL